MTNNTHILSDLSAILNPEHIRPGVNLKSLSENMISGGIIQAPKDPQSGLNDELRRISQEYGINMDILTPRRKDVTPMKSGAYSGNLNTNANVSGNVSMGNSMTVGNNISMGNSMGNNGMSSTAAYTQPSMMDNTPPETSHDDSGDDYGMATEQFPRSTTPRFQFDDTSALRDRTYEQERREHINKVNVEMGAVNAINFENEKREDIKDQMLEEIDSLRYTLREEEVDLTRVPEVGRQSTFDEVDSVLRILRHKNDRIRYCSFAEEFFLIGAYGLEELFDGKRLWLGKYKPDLTGWHNHVNVKLRRMRHDTSTLVSGVMHDFNIGPGMRLLLELVPNFLMYSKMKKQQHGAPSLYNDETVALNERLRTIDNL